MVAKDSCASDNPSYNTPEQRAQHPTPTRFLQAKADTAVNASKVAAYIAMLGDVSKKEYLKHEWYLHHTVAPFIVWWFSRQQHAMGIFGSVGEIGVQYGGFFLALATSSASGEQPYAIDIFDRQHLNLDASGSGAWKQFSANVEMLGFRALKLSHSKLSRATGFEPKQGSRTRRTVVAMQSLSTDITSAAIERLIPQPTRLISVDGGHSRESTCHDLNLAAAHLHDGGIVVVDDVGCCEKDTTWGLGVIDGVASFFAGPHRRELVPFFYYFPKLFLTTPAFAKRYQRAMRSDPLLNATLLRFDLGSTDRGARMHRSRSTLFGGELLRAGRRPPETDVRDAWLRMVRASRIR